MFQTGSNSYSFSYRLLPGAFNSHTKTSHPFFTTVMYVLWCEISKAVASLKVTLSNLVESKNNSPKSKSYLWNKIQQTIESFKSEWNLDNGAFRKQWSSVTNHARSTVKIVSKFTSFYRFIVLNLSFYRCILQNESFFPSIVLAFYRFLVRNIEFILSFYRFIVVKKIQSFSIVLSFHRFIVLSL